MDEAGLPVGWAATSLNAICHKVTDGSHNPPKKQETGMPMLSAVNIADRKINFEQYRQITPSDFAMEDKRTSVEPGNVLVTIVGTIGRTAVVPKEFPKITLQRSVAVLKPAEVDSAFLAYQIESAGPQSFMSKNAKGTAQKGIYLRTLNRMPVMLAPLPEQQRIVEKIETLFAELDKGEEALRSVQKLIARYRQSVLKAAVTGALTADWRAANASAGDNGKDMLAHILKTRRETWQGRGKYKEPVAPDTEGLPELPEGWVWATLDQLVSGRARSMQSGPFGSNLKHSEFQAEGVLVVGIDNVRDGYFSLGSEHRISQSKYGELRKYTARPGDLLVTVMASLGRSCVIPDDLETAIITKHVYRITMERELVAPEFYNLLLQTEWVSRRHMFENSQGQTRPGLNSTILRCLPVPLLSRSEQVEIVERVNHTLEEIVRLDGLVVSELKRSGALRQSILKDAFSGKLVPQDSSDEPAEELLKRIRGRHK